MDGHPEGHPVFLSSHQHLAFRDYSFIPVQSQWSDFSADDLTVRIGDMGPMTQRARGQKP
jgi:hypothetical protein